MEYAARWSYIGTRRTRRVCCCYFLCLGSWVTALLASQEGENYLLNLWGIWICIHVLNVAGGPQLLCLPVLGLMSGGTVGKGTSAAADLLGGLGRVPWSWQPFSSLCHSVSSQNKRLLQPEDSYQDLPIPKYTLIRLGCPEDPPVNLRQEIR